MSAPPFCCSGRASIVARASYVPNFTKKLRVRAVNPGGPPPAWAGRHSQGPALPPGRRRRVTGLSVGLLLPGHRPGRQVLRGDLVGQVPRLVSQFEVLSHELCHRLGRETRLSLSGRPGRMLACRPWPRTRSGRWRITLAAGGSGRPRPSENFFIRESGTLFGHVGHTLRLSHRQVGLDSVDGAVGATTSCRLDPWPGHGPALTPRGVEPARASIPASVVGSHGSASLQPGDRNVRGVPRRMRGRFLIFATTIFCPQCRR